jgi:hypothetical protein
MNGYELTEDIPVADPDPGLFLTVSHILRFSADDRKGREAAGFPDLCGPEDLDISLEASAALDNGPLPDYTVRTDPNPLPKMSARVDN